MARPRIAPSARSVPISFSVKPHLAEKIEEYSHQLRFSRSKFLAQAVTEAINKIELKHDLDDLDYRNFSDDRMLMLAKIRLDEAEEINPNVMKQLKDAIKNFERRQQQAKRDEAFATTQPQETVSEPRMLIDTKRIEAGRYSVIDFVSGEEVGLIYKDLNRTERPWIFSNHLDGASFSSRTLADAKDVAQEELEG